jgi:DNA-binding transcriptional LysR family regulator
MEGAGIAILDRLGAEDNLHRQIVIRPFLPEIAEDLILLSPASRPPSTVAEKFAVALRERFGIAGADRPI